MNVDLYSISNYLSNYLTDHGINFNQYGYPVIPDECILRSEPEEVLPYEHRNACKNPAKTVICYFTNDEHLYPRLNQLETDIGKLNGYMGVCGFDLSPRRGFDDSLQEFNLLINRMIDAYRAINGIKILPNFRTGDIGTLHSLSSYPAEAFYIAGSLGCSRQYVKQGDILLRTKLLYARPEKLFIYGSLKQIYRETLEEFGQDYRCIRDFRSASWHKKEAA